MFAHLKNLLAPQREAPQAPFAIAPSPATQPARPDGSAVYKSRGDNYLDENRFGEAAECYRLAIAANPDFAEAYDNLGIALWQQKQYEEAEHSLKQALRLKPGMAYTHYNLGSLLHEQGKLNDALLSFGKALEIMPYFAEAHLSIRDKIIANRTTAALFDSKRFTRNLEQAYEHMLQEAGHLPPAQIIPT